ncbi:MAG: ArsA family ATPase [Armatimonadetes bacterium]|nr:ArsA family ATPase [Armatimonadota bacterium]
MKKNEIPSFIKNKELKLIFFAGKGGSGKTTLAAACSLYYQSLGKKVLVISIDPAHSLGDVFGQKLTSKEKEIKPNLFAMEMNAKEIFLEFKEDYKFPIKKALERGTYLNSFEIDNLFSLSLPGLDEVSAFMKITDLIKNEEYDLIIVDTAPTGHTLVFLNLPSVFRKWIEILDLMQDKHRFIMRQFTKRYKEDQVDIFIQEMEKDLKFLREFLSNPQKCVFVLITVLEVLGLKELDIMLSELKKHKILVKDVIFNRVNFNQECPFCKVQSEHQEKKFSLIKENFLDYNLIKLPLFPYEIQGEKRINQFKEVLEGKEMDFKIQPFNFKIKERINKILPFKEKFIFFGGKGGVGKSTLAASASLFIALNCPDKKVLIISINPSHSLKDIFNLRENNLEKIKLKNNLYLLEINAPLLFEDFKKEYQKDLKEAFKSFLGNNFEIKFDQEIMQELINFSPPGIEEIMVLVKLMDFLDKEEFDFFIIDTAATGHLLRFMELPEVISQWNKAFLKILLKSKVNSLVLKEKMLDFLKKLNRLKEILKDQKLTQFIVITIPEALGLAEAERLLSSLKNLSIPCRNIIINLIIPKNECNFCLIKRKEQENYIDEFIKRTNDYQIIEAYYLNPQGIKGEEDLKKLSQMIFTKELKIRN